MNPQSFLTAFNAKAMSSEQVAHSFVSSAKFFEMAGQWNALLIGPRGSGKTTLLRMLSLDGLRAWDGVEAQRFRESLNFTGIYVPADIAWGEMVNSMRNQMDLNCFGMLSQAAFVTNVMSATVTAMALRVAPVRDASAGYRAKTIESIALTELIEQIGKLWKLKPRSASFLSLQNALSERLLEIGQAADYFTRVGGLTPEVLNDRLPYSLLPLISSINEAVAAFDRATGELDGKWALLLDEFEVAPDHLQKLVLNALRAGSSKLLFKVALAPCGPHTLLPTLSATPPTSKDDFRQVELWYADKAEAESFTANVFASRAKSEGVLDGKSPEEVFGRSAFAIVDETGQEKGDQLGKSRAEQYAKDFLSLAERDRSFAEFLIRKGIVPAELDVADSAANGTLIRKIAPIVAFRNAYLSNGPGKKRGRRPFTSAYSGWSAISAMSEGNPRWLIGMLAGMFAEVWLDDKLPIHVPLQQKHATDTAWKFASVLRTAAIQQFDQIQTSTPIFVLMSKIGNYFHDRLVVQEFKEDPPLSFVVDELVDSDTENCLRIAINHGAIVCYERADGIGGFASLKGKRFRLSYLLSPCFRLPVRKSKPVNLSQIIASELRVATPDYSSKELTQGSLF